MPPVFDRWHTVRARIHQHGGNRPRLVRPRGTWATETNPARRPCGHSEGLRTVRGRADRDIVSCVSHLTVSDTRVVGAVNFNHLHRADLVL